MLPTENQTYSKRRWIMVAGIASLVLAVAGVAWLVGRNGLRSTTEFQQSSERSIPMTNGAPPPPKLEEIEITIPPESLERIHLEFAKVTEASLTSEVRVPGTVQPNGYREVRTAALVGGIVTKVSAELGQSTLRGQPLAEIFSRDLAEAQTAFIGFSAELEAEHKKLVRSQELVRLGAASREELETVEANHQVHTAHVDEARQKLLLFGLTESQIDRVNSGRQVSSNITVPAPIDGVVIARSVNLGQVVAAGQELFTVTDLASVWIEGNLLENDFAAVQIGSRATITTPAYPGRTYRGTVEYIEPRVDPQTRTAKVRVPVENPGRALRIGMYADLVFTNVQAGKAVILPKAAVQTVASGSVVYVPVALKEGRFEQRAVRIGEETGGGFRVLEGLTQGDTVVTEGSVLLRAESLRQHPQ